MSAEALATDLRRTVAPVLSPDAVAFLDTYFEAGEWEIVIALAAESAFRRGLEIPAPAEVLDFADEMLDEDVRIGLRQRRAAV